MTTITESAARHMAAGIDDLDELARLIEQDTGKVPSKRTLSSCRSRFRTCGADWIEVNRRKIRHWRNENPEKNLAASNHWKSKNRAKFLLLQCHRRAKARGHECAITVEMIETMLAPMTCSATGLSLTWEHSGSSKANPWAPSIDRIDCSRGYVPGNVRLVCWAFNMMRGDFPDEVVFALAKALAARAL